MLLQIFGLTGPPTWWHINRLPAGGGRELGEHLNTSIPGAEKFEFYIDDVRLAGYTDTELSALWSSGLGQLVAKPADATPPLLPEPRLLLVTTQGPDAGRIFPLTRRNLSVGRGSAQAQVRDPWLSAHDFDIRLSSNGPVITPAQGQPIRWETDEIFTAGTTTFRLQRGAGDPLQAPKNPGAFEISPGQPPSPPNLLLQIIGAAAPLMIGIVLMVVTGMWYFLLFSGVSVIIAIVLITQYRRARNRFIQKIYAALAATSTTLGDRVFTPHQLMLALMSDTSDRLALTSEQPDNPVVHLGTGIRRAAMSHVQETHRWDQHLSARVDLILELERGYRTVIIGTPDMWQPLKNWCIVQLLRHAKATGTGLIIDGVHIGGPPVIEISQRVTVTPNPHAHQLVFTDVTTMAADGSTNQVNLIEHQVEGPWTATDIVPTGMSHASLDRMTYEVGFNQPNDQLSFEYQTLSARSMHNRATNELVTTLGTGSLGLEIDVVSDGPHMLITGTTGSGKSELLLTVLAGFVTRYPPCEVSMILLDFKGGSSFNVLASLPHTMSVETNHVSATSFRSLKAIAAELFRRESLFAEHQVADYAAFRRKVPHLVLPRLVVAIDELRVLVDKNPDASTTLAHLASTGRSLGFHLIIATQRTQGAVNADIRANIGSIIALRTATEHDSWEVLGNAAAFSISPATPGRAYFKAGADKPQLFQTSRYLLDDEPLIIQPSETELSPTLRTTTDWPALVQKLRDKAAALALPDPVILPPLPTQVQKSALETLSVKDTTAIGLVDDPAKTQQYPVSLGVSPANPDQLVLCDSVAWIGAAGSGIAEALEHVTQYVLSSDHHRLYLDGRHLIAGSSGWDTYLHSSEANGDTLRDVLTEITTVLSRNARMNLVIADWGSWTNALVTGSFQGLEDQLIQIMRQYAATLRVYVFGGRELAGGRLLGMIPDRFYLPKNSSAEHQMIWPKLLDVHPLTSRAVLVTAEEPNGGWEVQLVGNS